jgi:Flp pilus assembly protein TadD
MTLLCPIARCGAANDFHADSCTACGVPLRGYALLTAHADRLFNDGLAAARSNRLRVARDRFSAVVHWCPLDVEARNALALTHFQLGERAEAKRHWAQVLELRPGDPRASRGLEL